MNNSLGLVSARSAALGQSGHPSQSASQERMLSDSAGSTSGTSALPRETGHPLGIEAFGLRHLKTPSEIEKILHLREAIDLSVHSRAHSDFVALEKKETSAVSSGPLNCTGKP